MGAADRDTELTRCADGRLRMRPHAIAFERGRQARELGIDRFDCPYSDLLHCFGRGPWLIRVVHSYARAWREGWKHEAERTDAARTG